MKLKIGVIAHYSAMKSDFQHLAESEQCELLFKVGVLDLAVETAIEMERKDRVSAIITGANTARFISEYVTIPVIPLYTKSLNLISAFYEAKAQGEKIAFADLRRFSEYYDLEFIRKITGYDIESYYFEEISDVDRVLKDIIEDEREIIVTAASCMIAKSAKRNVKSILMIPQESDIRDAINIARHLAVARQEEMKKTQWIRAVVDASNDGVVTLDQRGIVSVVSKVGEDMIGMREAQLVGQHMDTLCDKYPLFQKLFDVQTEMEIIKHESLSLVVEKREVSDAQGNFMGTIYHLQELENIKSKEMTARKKISASGFVAQNCFDDIQGSSTSILSAKAQAKKFAQTRSNVLIYGESGTGKEIFAQSIHNYSPCSAGPFVAINCATLPEMLLESELFGYEEGAFTGARKGGKEGLLEMAHGGTLFLDEIAEMPIQLQSRLLRVLQDKVVRRVGGNKNIPVDVRIISATNRNIEREIEEGRFREDLYYRINVLNLTLPPLRDRKEDIPQIALMMAHRVAIQNDKPISIDYASLEYLKQRDWPGNVRELFNFIERVVVLAENQTIEMEEIQSALSRMNGEKNREITHAVFEDDAEVLVPIGDIKMMESYILRHIYAQCSGDKNQMKSILKMSDTTLWRRLKEIGCA